MDVVAKLITLIIGIILLICDYICGNGKITGGFIKKHDKIYQFINEYKMATKESLILHYSDIKNECEYSSFPQLTNFNCHIGQRKLLMNEIQFLSYFGDLADIVIYMGSAPCEHLTIIMDMFPDKKFILIDPNYHLIDTEMIYIYQNPDVISPTANAIYKTYLNGSSHQKRAALNLTAMKFVSGEIYNVVSEAATKTTTKNAMRDIKSKFMSEPDIMNAFNNSRVLVIQDYMTIELSQILKTALSAKILLISDLRTNLFGPSPTDLDIMYNEIIQINTMHDLRPQMTMLKFHPPFFSDTDLDLVARFGGFMRRFLANGGDFVRFGGVFGQKTAGVGVSSQMAVQFAVLAPYFARYSAIAGRDMLAEYSAKKYYHYAREMILLQPWAPKGSSESRLIIPLVSVVDGLFENYDYAEWERRYKYLNCYRIYYFNDVFLRNVANDAYFYCGCLDCILEQWIMLFYYLRIVKKNDISFSQTYDDLMALIDADCMSYLMNSYKKINKMSKYDLHYFRNAKCLAHGWNKRPHKIDYFFIKDANVITRTDGKNDIVASDLSDFVLTDNFDTSFCAAIRKLVLK